MTPETLEALRKLDEQQFLIAFSDAMRAHKLSIDELAAFTGEIHRRADAIRSARRALADMTTPYETRN